MSKFTVLTLLLAFVVMSTDDYPIAFTGGFYTIYFALRSSLWYPFLAGKQIVGTLILYLGTRE